jgi:hypothetical protein
VIHHRLAPPGVLSKRQPLGEAVITGRQIREEALRKPVAVAGDAQAHPSSNVFMARNRTRSGDQAGDIKPAAPL